MIREILRNQRKPEISDFTNVLTKKETATDTSKKLLGVESDPWRVIETKGLPIGIDTCGVTHTTDLEQRKVWRNDSIGEEVIIDTFGQIFGVKSGCEF